MVEVHERGAKDGGMGMGIREQRGSLKIRRWGYDTDCEVR